MSRSHFCLQTMSGASGECAVNSAAPKKLLGRPLDPIGMQVDDDEMLKEIAVHKEEDRGEKNSEQGLFICL